MFAKQIVGVVEPLEDATARFLQRVDVVRYTLLELVSSEDLEQRDQSLDRVGGDVAEDTYRTRLLTCVVGQEILQRKRGACCLDRLDDGRNRCAGAADWAERARAVDGVGR